MIGDGYRTSWDPRAPVIWDNFGIFRRNCATHTTYIAWIHGHVVGSPVDVVMLRDQLVRVARFSCGFFTAMTGNKAGNKNQDATRLQFRAVNEHICSH